MALSKPFRFLSEATTNLKVARSTDGAITGYIAANSTTEVKFLKLYDKATAPVLAEDIPFLVIAVPPTSTVHANFGTGAGSGLSFAKGLAFSIVKKGLDTNAEAVAAGDVSFTLLLDK